MKKNCLWEDDDWGWWWPTKWFTTNRFLLIESIAWFSNSSLVFFLVFYCSVFHENLLFELCCAQQKIKMRIDRVLHTKWIFTHITWDLNVLFPLFPKYLTYLLWAHCTRFGQKRAQRIAIIASNSNQEDTNRKKYRFWITTNWNCIEKTTWTVPGPFLNSFETGSIYIYAVKTNVHFEYRNFYVFFHFVRIRVLPNCQLNDVKTETSSSIGKRSKLTGDESCVV